MTRNILHYRTVNHDQLYVVAVHPQALFAYWHVSSRKMNMVSRHFGFTRKKLSFTLHVYDVTKQSSEAPLASPLLSYSLAGMDHIFIDNLPPGSVLFAELGINDEEQPFVPLLRSHLVTLPAEAGSSPRYTAISAHLLEDWFAHARLHSHSVEQFSAYSLYSPTADWAHSIAKEVPSHE